MVAPPMGEALLRGDVLGKEASALRVDETLRKRRSTIHLTSDNVTIPGGLLQGFRENDQRLVN